MTELLPVNVRQPSKRVERESRDRSEEGGRGGVVSDVEAYFVS